LRITSSLTVPKTRSRLSTPGEQEVMAGASDRFAAWARLGECYREKLEKHRLVPATVSYPWLRVQAEARTLLLGKSLFLPIARDRFSAPTRCLVDGIHHCFCLWREMIRCERDGQVRLWLAKAARVWVHRHCCPRPSRLLQSHYESEPMTAHHNSPS
jgi:hypothetical protein